MHVKRSAKHTEVLHRCQKIPLALTRTDWHTNSIASNKSPPSASLRRFRAESIVYALRRTSRACRATSVRRRPKQRVPSGASSATYKTHTRTGAAAIASQWGLCPTAAPLACGLLSPRLQPFSGFLKLQQFLLRELRCTMLVALPWSSGALGRRTSRRRSSHPLGSRTSS